MSERRVKQIRMVFGLLGIYLEYPLEYCVNITEIMLIGSNTFDFSIAEILAEIGSCLSLVLSYGPCSKHFMAIPWASS
jgi:hypothetical protein